MNPYLSPAEGHSDETVEHATSGFWQAVDVIWRWFFRCVVGAGLLVVVLSAMLVIGMNTPKVTQSDGFTKATPQAVANTISNSLPPTASHIRYCRASVGLGGRLLIYRFSAPIADLHSHAAAEFAAHWDKPEFASQQNVAAPFNERNVDSFKAGFGIDASWIVPPPDSVGTIYEPADGRSSHRPVIFVDETHETFYFVMTD